MTLQEFLKYLPDAKCSGAGWSARCPAHEDKTPSLSISQGDHGGILLHCHAGCKTSDILESLGLTMTDLMPDPVGQRRPSTKNIPASRRTVFYHTALEAAQTLNSNTLQLAHVWTYEDADGQPLLAVARYHQKQGKTFRQFRKTDRGWCLGGLTGTRPLYQLPQILRSSGRVYVVEGEKAADAGWQIGLICTTSPQGSRSPEKAEWQGLQNRQVIILPNEDDPGTEFALRVMKLLRERGITQNVCVVKLPGLPDHGDLYDFLQIRRDQGISDEQIKAEIESLADSASALTYPPMMAQRGGADSIPDYQPFPVAALPSAIGDFVKAAAEALGCDPTYIVLPALSVAAACLGNSVRVRLKRDWIEPPVLWTAIIGESGTLKSPAWKLAIQPLKTFQYRVLLEYRSRMKDYEAEMEDYLLQKSKNKKNKGDTASMEKPQEPQAQRYWVCDTTLEALAPVLLHNPRGVLCAVDELAGWVRNFDRYVAGGKGGEAPRWISMYDADSINIDRKTGPTRHIMIPSAAVSLTGTIQPGILRKCFTREHRDSGLLARLLMAMPPARPAYWTEADIPEAADYIYQAVLSYLLDWPILLDQYDTVQPHSVSLNAEAKKLFVDFVNTHAEENIQYQGDLAAVWSKLKGITARLALIFQCVKTVSEQPDVQPQQIEIDDASVESAITVVNWFKNEARRIYQIFEQDDQQDPWDDLIPTIVKHDGQVTPRDLMRFGPCYKNTAQAKAALDTLVQKGMGYWHKTPPGPSGGAPTLKFILTKIQSK